MKQYKKILFFVMLISVSVLSFTIVSCDNDDDNFTDKVPDIAEAIIRSFKVNDEFATINQTSATITATLPSGTDLSKLKIDMTLPEGTTVDPASGSTLDFSKGPIIFTTKATNGASREYTATLAAFGNPKILSFSIGKYTGVIDDVKGTINVVVGNDAGAIPSLTTNFVIADGTTVDISSGASQNFTNPVVYKVQSNDGFTVKEYTVTVNQVAINSFVVDGVNGVVNTGAEEILLVMPQGTDLSSLTPVIGLDSGLTVDPASDKAQDFSSGSVTYTVSNADGVKSTYVVTAEIIIPTKVAFISNANSPSDISEPDTRAAAEWLESTYPDDFKYIKVSDLSTLELADVKVTFLYYDNTDSFNIPNGSAEFSGSQIAILSNYVKAGGHMFAAGFGTRIIDDMGRIPHEAGIAGNGAGGNNDDNWGINFGTGIPTDVTGHAMYNGVSTTDVSNPVSNATLGHDFMPLISTGHKEDHNSMWDLGAMSELTEPHASVARGTEFEGLYDATILGTWQHVTDMCCIAAMELHSNSSFIGTIIAVGPVAYEWSMDDNHGATNPWQSNVELMTKNAIDYLYNLKRK